MPPTQKALNMEQWRDIPGYEGLYEVSNMGRIRTNANKVTSNTRFPVRRWKQRIMKQKYHKRRSGKADARVCLWKGGKEKTFLVSRLVALAWCEGYRDGMTVDHIDGNPENNHANNLEWVSLADNIRRGFENGLYPTTRPVSVEVDGTTRDFRSMAEASRALGYNSGYLSCKLRREARAAGQ